MVWRSLKHLRNGRKSVRCIVYVPGIRIHAVHEEMAARVVKRSKQTYIGVAVGKEARGHEIAVGFVSQDAQLRQYTTLSINREYEHRTW